MPTVAQIVPEMHSGGVERGTLEVANALVEAGHRSIVISAGGRMVEALEAGGTEHIELPVGRKSPLTLRLVPRLRSILSQREVSVLHARSRVPAWLSVLALKRAPHRPAFVTTVHGLYSVSRYSRVMTRGDRVVCVSDTVREYVRENYPDCPEAKLVTIHRGVDPDAYARSFRAPAEWESEFRNEFQLGERPLILLPGRLTRLKGHEDFLDMMAVLAERGSDAMGVIVGGRDPRRERYAEEITSRVAGAGNVVMTGHRNDLREIMSVSSVVLSLSRKPESFGRTVLESLTLGVPVLGYDHGGVSEVLQKLYPKGRVPLGDIDHLATSCETLLSSQSASILENTMFTLDQMLCRTLELYSAVGQSL